MYTTNSFSATNKPMFDACCNFAIEKAQLDRIALCHILSAGWFRR